MRVILIIACFLMMTLRTALAEDSARFSLPIDCVVGETCFLQNLADFDQETNAISDTICGQDTYNNHKGIDIRVLSLKETEKGVNVLAMADGIVRGFRDEITDRLVGREGLAPALKGRECGNGVVIEHGQGLSAQYCHMKRGSLNVRKGQTVSRGDVLGEVGVSGFSAFPHIHLALRLNGKLVDALSGAPLEVKSCLSQGVVSGYFGRKTLEALLESRDDILQIGLADKAFSKDVLVQGNVPPIPTMQSNAIVGWGWAINAHKGDQMRIAIENEAGVFHEKTSDPLSRRKAVIFNFSGRKITPKAGTYTLTVTLIRDGQVIEKKSDVFQVN